MQVETRGAIATCLWWYGAIPWTCDERRRKLVVEKSAAAEIYPLKRIVVLAGPVDQKDQSRSDSEAAIAGTGYLPLPSDPPFDAAVEIPLKRCSKCGLELPRTAFYADRQKKDGLHPRCKQCNDRPLQERAARKRDQRLQTKKELREKAVILAAQRPPLVPSKFNFTRVLTDNGPKSYM